MSGYQHPVVFEQWRDKDDIGTCINGVLYPCINKDTGQVAAYSNITNLSAPDQPDAWYSARARNIAQRERL